jgi:hypothetical protein
VEPGTEETLDDVVVEGTVARPRREDRGYAQI